MTVCPKVPLRPSRMNRTEAAWADVLDLRRRKGEVREFWYASLTLLLGDDCRYTPDFAVVTADGTLELHEVKGHMRDDALVKLKTCARAYPMPLYLVRKGKGMAFTVTRVAA